MARTAQGSRSPPTSSKPPSPLQARRIPHSRTGWHWQSTNERRIPDELTEDSSPHAPVDHGTLSSRFIAHGSAARAAWGSIGQFTIASAAANPGRDFSREASCAHSQGGGRAGRRAVSEARPGCTCQLQHHLPVRKPAAFFFLHFSASAWCGGSFSRLQQDNAHARERVWKEVSESRHDGERRRRLFRDGHNHPLGNSRGVQGVDVVGVYEVPTFFSRSSRLTPFLVH